MNNMKKILYTIIILLSLTVNSFAQTIVTAPQVIPSSEGVNTTIYKVCIDGLLFYIITTVNGKAMVQPFEHSPRLDFPPQPIRCIGIMK